VKLPNGEIRQPTLYDISGSSRWYNAADHGEIICGDTTSNVSEVMVEKSRYRAVPVSRAPPIVFTAGRRGAARPYSGEYAQRKVREAHHRAGLGKSCDA
jgi:hypothetical protein